MSPWVFPQESIQVSLTLKSKYVCDCWKLPAQICDSTGRSVTGESERQASRPDLRGDGQLVGNNFRLGGATGSAGPQI